MKIDKNKLMYDIEYKCIETRDNYMNKIRNNNLTLREIFELGFDNNYLKINDKFYNLGFVDFNGVICNSDFKNIEQLLDIKLKYYNYDICDYNYITPQFTCLTEDDEKLFIKSYEED